jgi:hypothetical protein
MSGFRLARRCGVLAGVAALWATAAWAQGQPAPTSAGAETKTGIKAASIKFYN